MAYQQDFDVIAGDASFNFVLGNDLAIIGGFDAHLDQADDLQALAGVINGCVVRQVPDLLGELVLRQYSRASQVLTQWLTCLEASSDFGVRTASSGWASA